MKRKKRILIGLISLSTLVVSSSIGVTTMTILSSDNTANLLEENIESPQHLFFNEKGSVVSGNDLTFSAMVSPSSMKKNKSNNENPSINMGEGCITPPFTGGWINSIVDENGSPKTEKKYLSTEYYNNRIYMPIMDSKNHNYSNERTGYEVEKNIYPGWIVNENNINELNKGLYTYEYEASSLLNSTKKLIDDSISVINIDLTSIFSIDEANKEMAEGKYDFVIISGIDKNTKISEIRIPDGTKKLTLKAKDFDFSWDEKIGINDLYIPDSIYEVELYLGSSLDKINPLIFSDNTNIISDVALTNGMSSVFKEIKIDDENMDNNSANLQKAIDITYKYRIKERAFQGITTGGYISSWDLTKTKVDSFNDVEIPPLTDGIGRYFIGHVEIKTSSYFGNSQNEIISSDSSTNDSLINSWFDHGGGWQNVSEVVVNSKKEISIETATREIMGFIAKYPNVKIIDIKNIKLSNGNHKDLTINIKKELESKYGKDSKYLEIEYIYYQDIETIN